MTNQDAIKTLMASVKYITKEDAMKSMKNAVSCFAELKGWTPQNAMMNFVELALTGAKEYKNNPMNTYKLVEANDASNIALYIDNQAAKDIIELRVSK